MKIIIIFFLLTALNSYSQNVDSSKALVVFDTTRDESGKAKLSWIIQLKEIQSKDQIFEKTKLLIHKYFTSGNNVIQYENKEEGKIFCKAVTNRLIYKNMGAKMDGGYFFYELNIYCKDGKVRFVFSNITHQKGDMAQMKDGSDYGDAFPSTWGKLGKSQTEKQWPLMKQQALNDIALLVTSISNDIEKKDDSNF